MTPARYPWLLSRWSFVVLLRGWDERDEATSRSDRLTLEPLFYRLISRVVRPDRNAPDRKFPFCPPHSPADTILLSLS